MKINGHEFSISTALMILGMVAAMAASWFVWGQQAGEIKQRVTTVEKRQEEDRTELRNDQREIKQDVKQTATDVQTILRKLGEMEAVQRAEERRRWRER